MDYPFGEITGENRKNRNKKVAILVLVDYPFGADSLTESMGISKESRNPCSSGLSFRSYLKAAFFLVGLTFVAILVLVDYPFGG